LRPVHDILIELEKPLEDTIELSNGLVLYKSAEYDLDWNVSTTGKVSALPEDVKEQLGISEKDDVAFSFSVVADRSFPNDSDVFYPHLDHPHLQRFLNGKGESLQIIAINGVITLDWICTYCDAKGNFITGVHGKERDVSKFKSQFSFSNNAVYTFKNAIDVADGKTLWRAKPEDVYAKRINGKIEAVGDRLILKPIVIDVKHKIELAQGKPLPFQEVKLRLYDRAELVHDAPDLKLKKGDIVSFESQYCEKYSLWNEQYFLIKKRRAMGVWCN
jgi:hypothetical protein